mmetsp:Transcript_81334/g.218727  ORF Transcript_81334/g.218727 Transcript_81334/m.218727 type:complete len:125 (-) Transcript_81334:139-513(-)
MNNVIGGKLKLKKPIESAIKKKKKSSSSSKSSEPAHEESHHEHDEVEDKSDTRTKYEKKWEEQVKKMDTKNAKKIAEKSHRYFPNLSFLIHQFIDICRDRVNDFNEKLSKMSEHYDIPRVAGGG